MKTITKYLIIFISVLSAYSSSAQQNLTLYNMEVVPQRMYANPAFFPSYSKVNIGLPMLSSQYVNISNSGFKYSDFVRRRADDSLYIDMNNMISQLKDNNYLSVSYQPDLLSFGFAIKEVNYFSFNITEKIDFRFRYPKGFMEFVGYLNGGPQLGKEIKFNLGIDFTHYREYGFGYSRIVNEKLTVGGKLKYLYGMENVWTEKADLSLTTDATDFTMTAKSNLIINTSIDSNLINGGDFSPMQYALKKNNKGFGVDLGGVYKLNNKITLSASLIDLGFIKWKDDVVNYQSVDPNGTYVFRGADMVELINDTTGANPLESIGDSLSNAFETETVNNTYKTNLSTQIYIGGNYNLNDKTNAGVLLYGQIFDKSIHSALSLSFNQRVGRWLNYSLTYSMYNRSYNNVGLGIGLNLGPIQLYLISDNLLGAIQPQNTKNAHIHAGLNLTFGRIKKDKDQDGVPDNKDKCPEIPGTIEFNGCPDTDLDHIQDSEDLCPKDSGRVELRGCPDRDGDDVSDITDSCPNIVGLVTFNGCPDMDGDSIMDMTDSCPDVAGIPALNGCPDTDGDGITDKSDACPDKKGPKSNNGCPLAKLNLVDTLGTTINSATIEKGDNFTFDTIPFTDELARFTIEGDKTEKVKKVNIKVGGTSKVAIKDKDDKYFRFAIEPVVDTVPKADTPEKADIPVKEEEPVKVEEKKVKEEKKEEAKEEKIEEKEEVKEEKVEEKVVVPAPIKTDTVIDTIPILPVEVAIILEESEAEVLKKAFNNLEFETGKNVIKKESYPSLNELAILLTKKVNWKLKVSGHTDNQGNAASNLVLSEKRSIAIKIYLVSQGIAPNRIKVAWFGSTKPIADNATAEGRQKNRRVEMLIIE